MDDSQTPWLRLALCPNTPSTLLRELLYFSANSVANSAKKPPKNSQPHINQTLSDWLATDVNLTDSESAKRQLSLLLPEEFHVDTSGNAWAKLRKALLNSDINKHIEAAYTWERGASNRHLITPAHPAWPNQLHALSDPPVLLYAIGNPALLAMDQVAMVGARRSTIDGKATARRLAYDLSCGGWVVTSGLALGIDTEAHRGCLEGGSPTLAVMATDANGLYPKQNRALATDILDSDGCLITETPLGMPLARYCFPRRNRLISSLSQGVVVIEAAIKSGTITTAKHAATQGREVMAVPGSVRNPQVTGCHQLIRDGATLVTSATDIAECVGPCQNRKNGQNSTNTMPEATSHRSENIDNTLSKQADILLEAIGYDAAPLESLVARTGWNASKLVTLLMQLELQGQVTRDLAGHYSLT